MPDRDCHRGRCAGECRRASCVRYRVWSTRHGKSTDAARAFTKNGRCNAFFIPCEDGALKAIAARGMPVPDHPKQTVKSWGAMCEALGWLYEHRANYVGCVIDGLSAFSSYITRRPKTSTEGTRTSSWCRCRSATASSSFANGCAASGYTAFSSRTHCHQP